MWRREQVSVQRELGELDGVVDDRRRRGQVQLGRDLEPEPLGRADDTLQACGFGDCIDLLCLREPTGFRELDVEDIGSVVPDDLHRVVHGETALVRLDRRLDGAPNCGHAL